MAVNFLPVCQTSYFGSAYSYKTTVSIHKRERERKCHWKKERKKTRALHTNYWNYVKRAVTFLPQYFLRCCSVCLYINVWVMCVKLASALYSVNPRQNQMGWRAFSAHSIEYIALSLSLDFFYVERSPKIYIKWTNKMNRIDQHEQIICFLLTFWKFFEMKTRL